MAAQTDDASGQGTASHADPGPSTGGRVILQSTGSMRLPPLPAAENAAPLIELDTIDLGIIAVLRENGRATNQEIADRMGISPATVSARVRRFEEQNAMRVVAVTDFAAHGYTVLIAVGVQVWRRRAEDVARDLARFPEIFSINLMTGVYDLEMLVALRDFSEVDVFLHEHIAGVDGIRHLEPGIAIDVVKFQFNVAPL